MFNNTDAVIWFGGIGIMLIVWALTTVVLRRKYIKQLTHERYEYFMRGWDLGTEDTLEFVFQQPYRIRVVRHEFPLKK